MVKETISAINGLTSSENPEVATILEAIYTLAAESSSAMTAALLDACGLQGSPDMTNEPTDQGKKLIAFSLLVGFSSAAILQSSKDALLQFIPKADAEACLQLGSNLGRLFNGVSNGKVSSFSDTDLALHMNKKSFNEAIGAILSACAILADKSEQAIVQASPAHESPST